MIQFGGELLIKQATYPDDARASVHLGEGSGAASTWSVRPLNGVIVGVVAQPDWEHSG